MSHTYTAPGGATFCYNPDLSGVTVIMAPHPSGGEAQEILLGGEDLMAFASEILRRRCIAKLEGLPRWAVFRAASMLTELPEGGTVCPSPSA